MKPRATTAVRFDTQHAYVALPGGPLRVDFHLQDVAAGETLISVKETGEEGNLFDLVSRAGVQLREKVDAAARLTTTLPRP